MIPADSRDTDITLHATSPNGPGDVRIVVCFKTRGFFFFAGYSEGGNLLRDS